MEQRVVLVRRIECIVLLMALAVAPATVRAAPTKTGAFVPNMVMDVGCGPLVIENFGRTNFTIILKASDSKQLPMEGGTVFVIDGALLQVSVAEAAEMGAPKARGSELLKRHMLWETDFVARSRGWAKLVPSSKSFDMGVKGFSTMVWGYDPPEPFEIMNQKINRMMYVSAAVDDVVFVIGAPLRLGDDTDRVLRVIKRGMATLERYRRPVDPDEIAKEIDPKRPVWRGCEAAR